jgi:hypothetical protein
MAGPATPRRIAGYAALALPLVAILWVPLYARTEPSLAGLPFFYVYQFAWIALTTALLALSYRLLRPSEPPPGQSPELRRDE